LGNIIFDVNVIAIWSNLDPSSWSCP